MPSYELYYFNARGRAEVARLCFNYAGIPFKDHRFNHEEWPKLKSDTSRFPQGQVPVLLIDGRPLTESHAINRYAAKITGLDGGSDPVEAAFVDEAYELCRSFIDSIHHYYIVALGYAPGDKDQMYKDVFVPNAQKHLPRITSLLKSNGFFGEKGVTFADFYIACYVESFLKLGIDEVNKFPAIVKHLKDVKDLPKLQGYLKSRPHTNS